MASTGALFVMNEISRENRRREQSRAASWNDTQRNRLAQGSKEHKIYLQKLQADGAFKEQDPKGWAEKEEEERREKDAEKEQNEERKRIRRSQKERASEVATDVIRDTRELGKVLKACKKEKGFFASKAECYKLAEGAFRELVRRAAANARVRQADVYEMLMGDRWQLNAPFRELVPTDMIGVSRWYRYR